MKGRMGRILSLLNYSYINLKTYIKHARALLGTENIRISKTQNSPCPPEASSLEGATGINQIITFGCKVATVMSATVAGGGGGGMSAWLGGRRTGI